MSCARRYVAIQSKRMFAVTDGKTTDYTRAVNFYLDNQGNIVNPDGYYLMGFNATGGEINQINIPDEAQSFSIATDGTVNYVDDEGEPQIAGQIGLAQFSNPEGLEKVGSNLFLNSTNSGLNEDGLQIPEEEGMGKIVAGALEMSNVDLAEEFTEMIVAQ